MPKGVVKEGGDDKEGGIGEGKAGGKERFQECGRNFKRMHQGRTREVRAQGGVAWRGVARCGAAWRGVAWSGSARHRDMHASVSTPRVKVRREARHQHAEWGGRVREGVTGLGSENQLVT